MNPRNSTTRLAHHSLVKPLFIAIAALVAVAAIVTPQASAFAVSSTGSPGYVTFNRTIMGSHLPGFGTPYLQHQVTDVCRSPLTAGPQTVSALYVVQKSTGGAWSKVASENPLKATIAAGVGCGRVSNFGWGQNYLTGGYFYVEALYVWQDAFGNVLGTKLVRFNGVQDYSCATVQCQVFPGGFIYVR